MRKILVYFILASAIIITARCGSKTKPPAPSEANLVVTLTPPENSTQAPAPQLDFPLVVTITSTMPPQGVTISVTAKREDNSVVFFTSPVTSTSSATSNFSIIGTPVSVVCITTVTVTSKTKATNTWTGTYRYSRKP